MQNCARFFLKDFVYYDNLGIDRTDYIIKPHLRIFFVFLSVEKHVMKNEEKGKSDIEGMLKQTDEQFSELIYFM